MVVEKVAPRGAGARAGVLRGDRLVGVDSVPMGSVEALVAAVSQLSSGTLVQLHLERAGVPISVVARAAPLPPESLEGGTVELTHVLGAHRARLRAIYTQPAAPGPHPAILYLQALDWGSCEHPLAPAHPVRRLVAGFTQAGFAMLRVERSGVGDSEGPPCTELGFEDELVGLRAGLAHLSRRPEVSDVFLFGNSLGGMQAPLVVTDAVRGVVVFGTSAARWHDCLLGGFVRQRARDGEAEDVIARERTLLEELQHEVLRRRRTPREVYAERPHVAAAGFTHYRDDRAFGRVVSFFQALEAVELGAAWSRCAAPVLALHGEHDVICSAEEAAELAAFARGQALELAGVDHGGSEPGAIERVVEASADWMRARLPAR